MAVHFSSDWGFDLLSLVDIHRCPEFDWTLDMVRTCWVRTCSHSGRLILVLCVFLCVYVALWFWMPPSCNLEAYSCDTTHARELPRFKKELWYQTDLVLAHLRIWFCTQTLNQQNKKLKEENLHLLTKVEDLKKQAMLLQRSPGSSSTTTLPSTDPSRPPSAPHSPRYSYTLSNKRSCHFRSLLS